jgi:short-subunit dehydrogenase
MELKDNVVIVTGASSGIGLATAKLLAKEGAKLVLVARSKDKLDALAKELPGSLAIPTDMTKPVQVKRMVRTAKTHFGRIDVLINNAGQGYDAPVEKTDIKTLRGIYELDLVGPLIAMEKVIPIMRRQGGGAIINISSGTALMVLPDNGVYSALKRALAQVSLTAREELKGDKISVSVVYPYITDTDFEKNTIKNDVVEQQGEGGEGGGPPFPPDSAEYVAGKIAEAIKTGDAEVYAHDWMTKIGK